MLSVAAPAIGCTAAAGLLVWALLDDALVANGSPAIGLVGSAVLGGAYIDSFRKRVASARTSRSAGPTSWAHAVSFALLGTAGTVLLIVGAGSLACLLGVAGWTLSDSPPTAELHVNTLFAHFVWEVVDAVPVVEATATLGWERPIADPAPVLGAVLLVTRATFALIVVAGAAALWMLVRDPRDAPLAARPDVASSGRRPPNRS